MVQRKKQNNVYKSILGVGITVAVMLFMAIGSSIAQHRSDGEVDPIESSETSDNLYAPASQAPTHGKGGNSAQLNSSEGSSTISRAEQDNVIKVKLQERHQTVPEVTDGEAYVEVNDNIPLFKNNEIASVGKAWERYGRLDHLGRVTTAEAMLGVELMPAEGDERDSLTSVTPTGWVQKSYDHINSGGWLYNRAHLIGYQLAGEQDNMHNLMTGTRYFNVEGMLPFENYVANYIEENEVHVRYRITPMFVGDELLARGIFMEGYSIEDDGELAFHIFVPNIQPGIELDYSTGDNRAI